MKPLSITLFHSLTSPRENATFPHLKHVHYTRTSLSHGTLKIYKQDSVHLPHPSPIDPSFAQNSINLPRSPSCDRKSPRSESRGKRFSSPTANRSISGTC